MLCVDVSPAPNHRGAEEIDVCGGGEIANGKGGLYVRPCVLKVKLSSLVNLRCRRGNPPIAAPSI